MGSSGRRRWEQSVRRRRWAGLERTIRRKDRPLLTPSLIRTRQGRTRGGRCTNRNLWKGDRRSLLVWCGGFITANGYLGKRGVTGYVTMGECLEAAHENT